MVPKHPIQQPQPPQQVPLQQPVLLKPPTTAPTTTEAPTKFEELKIGETPIAEYTIVYAKSPYEAELYKNSCLGSMESLKKKNPDLKFVLANCPAYFGGSNFGSAQVRLIQKALYSTAKEAGYPTTFFDMYSVTQTMRDYFPDSVHPNDMGHMKMAEQFAAYLQTLIASVTSEAE